jgi:hypothetical protein
LRAHFKGLADGKIWGKPPASAAGQRRRVSG